MTSITVNFSNASVTAGNVLISLDGGSFGLSITDPLSLAGTFNFTQLYVTSGGISFNVASGTSFNGSVVANAASDSPGTPPEIEVTNFSGDVTVTWPTKSGPQTQTLEPSTAMTLSGYLG